jgi:hypothetical protein
MCCKEEIWQRIHVKIRGKSVCAKSTKMFHLTSKVRGRRVNCRRFFYLESSAVVKV